MKEGLEARVGIEPTRKGFADLSLTTWVPRLGISKLSCSGVKIQRADHLTRISEACTILTLSDDGRKMAAEESPQTA